MQCVTATYAVLPRVFKTIAHAPVAGAWEASMSSSFPVWKITEASKHHQAYVGMHSFLGKSVEHYERRAKLSSRRGMRGENAIIIRYISVRTKNSALRHRPLRGKRGSEAALRHALLCARWRHGVRNWGEGSRCRGRSYLRSMASEKHKASIISIARVLRRIAATPR